MYPLYGTVFLNWYFMALGVNVGSNVYLGSTNIYGNDLISIGDDSSVNCDAQMEAIRVVQGWIVLGRIVVGKRCYVASRSMIIASPDRDTVISDDGQLGELSLLPGGSVIPKGQNWAGSPARYACDVPELSEEMVGDDVLPVDWMIREEAKEKVLNAMETLSPDRKELIWLVVVEGYSHGEVARIMDIPEGTARSRLHYTLKSLREKLQNDGVSYE